MKKQLPIRFLLPILIGACGGLEIDQTQSGALTTSIVPNGNETPTNWTGDYKSIDEASCNGNTDYVSSSTLNAEECYDIPLSAVPAQALMTEVQITPCASRNAPSGTSQLQVGYKWGGGAITYGSIYNLTNNTPTNQTATNINVEGVDDGVRTLHVCVKSANANGLRVSRLGVVVRYTAAPSSVLISQNPNDAGTAIVSTLSCTDNSDNETGFEWEYTNNSGTSWNFAGLIATCALTNHSSFPANGQYSQYRVRAMNGVSAGSGWVYGPAGLIKPTSLVASTVPFTTLRLTWTDVDTTNSEYRVYRSSTGNSGWVDDGVSISGVAQLYDRERVVGYYRLVARTPALGLASLSIQVLYLPPPYIQGDHDSLQESLYFVPDGGFDNSPEIDDGSDVSIRARTINGNGGFVNMPPEHTFQWQYSVDDINFINDGSGHFYSRVVSPTLSGRAIVRVRSLLNGVGINFWESKYNMRTPTDLACEPYPPSSVRCFWTLVANSQPDSHIFASLSGNPGSRTWQNECLLLDDQATECIFTANALDVSHHIMVRDINDNISHASAAVPTP